MKDSDYRALAVEFVRQIEELLIHRGSKNALNLAEAWARGEAVGEQAKGLALERATEDRRRCAKEAQDGRSYAAEAACHLLAPSAKNVINEVAAMVAKAKATRAVLQKYGTLSPLTQDAHEYFRAVELELLIDSVSRREAGESALTCRSSAVCENPTERA
jgi:hypothetical protein